jgi:hypothetical protein
MHHFTFLEPDPQHNTNPNISALTFPVFVHTHTVRNTEGVYYMTLRKPGVISEVAQPCSLLQARSQRHSLKTPMQ